MKTFAKLFNVVIVIILLISLQKANAQTPQFYNYSNVGTSSNSFPLGQSAGKQVQSIFLAGDFNQPNAVSAGNQITDIYIFITTAGTRTFTDLTVMMAQDNITTLTSGTFYSGTLQTVYYSPSTIMTATANSWAKITLTTPFPYDPSKSLIVSVGQCGASGSGLSVRNNSLSDIRRVWSVGGCPFLPYTGGDAYTVNFGIDVEPAISVTNDAGVVSIDSPTSFCAGTENIVATIKNFGINQISSVTVNWSLNSTLQTPISWTGLLDTAGGTGSNTSQILLGSYNFLANTTTNITAWTSNPNSVTDTVTSNDTAQVSLTPAFSGTFTIGGTSPDYATFSAAVSDLNSFGVCGPVVFNVASGTYSETVTIPEISGASSTNTITFQSASGDSTSVTLTGNGAYILQLNGADYVTIKGITIQTTATSSTKAVEVLSGANYNTITNCVINVPTTSTSSAYGIYNSSGLDEYNLISNNYIMNSYYGIYWYGGSSTLLEKGNRIEGNMIDGFYYYGIYSYGQDSINVKYNTLINSSSAGAGYGIYLYYCDNAHQTIGNNVQMSGTSTLYGINIYYTDGNASAMGLTANNFVSINGSGTQYGIRNYYSSYQNVYNNSVNIVGSGTTGYGLYLYNNSASYTGHNILNNIFANSSTSGYAAYYYNGTNLTSSDYNDFHSTGNNFVYWAGAKADLLTLQTSSSMDANSLSVDPGFTSSTDLHTSAVTLDGAATPIVGITTDIDGDLRDATNPDIGADEYVLMQHDAGVFALDAPIAPCPGNNNVIVTVKNYGVTALTSVNVNWEVNGVSQTPVAYTTTIPVSGDASVTLGSYNFVTGINYIIKAWTSNPNGLVDQNNSNDTLYSGTIQTAISGTFTIGGTSPDYTTFAAAISDLNSNGVCGPVVFNIANGTYSEQVSIGSINGASATNNITFQSASGDSTSVTLTGNGAYILQLNGADYVTIKGITIQTTATSSTKAVEVLSGANYNTITNCVINVPTTSTSSAYGIYNSSGIDIFNTFSYNKIMGAYYAMYMYGSSSSVWEKGNVIKGNDISGFYYYGIYSYYQDSIQILNNYIHDNATTTGYVYGIQTYYNYNGFNISANNISIAPGSYGYALRCYYGNYYSYYNSSFAPGLVSNNFLSVTSGTYAYGLYAYYSNNVEYYYNSVNITGGTSASYPLYQYNTTSNTIGQTFKNNIFVNSSGSYAAYFSTTATVSATDYNNYFTTGSNLAYWGGARTDLTALQTASNMDANSFSVDPGFTSSTDLHATAVSLDGAATPIAVITTDIDGDVRDATNPDIGADEYVLMNRDAGVFSLDAPIAPCPGINNVVVTIKNFGVQALTSVNINWEVNGVLQSPVAYTTTIAVAGDASVTLGSYNFLIGINYIIKAWTSNPNTLSDQDNSNDTLLSGTIKTAMSGTFTIGGTNPDYSTFTAAITDLITSGVCGPVVYNVANGIYSETGSIPEINGATATNTITFKSASGDSSAVIITGSGAYILQLNATDYVTIKGMTIKTTSTSSTKAIELLGGANHNTITNCVIDVPVTSTSSAYGIYNSSGLDEYNLISNNYIKNGYYGIYWYSGSSTLLEKGNRIEGNIIDGFYYYGIYSYGQDSINVKYNTLINSSSAGAGYGIYLYYCDNAHQTIGNNVQMSGTSTLYGINIYYTDGNSSAMGLIANNFVSIIGSGTQYGIRNYYSSYQNVYNNSVNISGSGTTGYGLYLYNSSASYTGHNILNNIFANSSTSGYAAYYYNGTNLTSSDYNDFYSSGNNFVYWAGAKADLLTLQTASSMDANSVSIDPDYSSNIDLHVFSLAMENLGTPLIEVTTDIDGEIRHATTPDIGADEYTLPANDIGVMEILSPVKSICLPSSDSIVVVVKNFGTNAQISVSVGVKYTDPSGTTTYSTTLASLAAGGKDTITVANLTSFSFGAYSLKAYTSLSGDLNVNNDTTISVFTFDSPQTTPFTQDFNTWPPSNWSFAGTRSWTQDASSNSAYTNFWSWSSGNAEMYTPLVSLSGLSNAQLKFDRSYYYNTSYIDTLRISIKACGGNWVTIFDKNGQNLSTNDGAGNTSAGSFEATNINIPQSFVGQNILVKFDGISDYGPNLYIDNVVIGEAPIVNLGNDTCVCSTHDIILDAGAGTGYTYSWYTSAASNVIASTQTITVDSAATYFVKVIDANGLIGYDTINVCINALPVVSFSGLNSNYCIDAAAVTLTGSPTGGTFSGNGVSAGTFSPSVALAGTHSVKYIYTNANGCTDSISQSVIVNPLPVLMIGSLADKCFNSPAFALGFASPTGGTYSGSGVSVSGDFIAANAGAGTHYIKYEYIDVNGCYNVDSTTQTVHTLPVLTTSATPDTVYYGTPTTLNVAVSGSSTYSYLWTPVDSLSGVGQATLQSPTTKNLHNLTTFTVVVTDNSTSCSNSKQQTVPIKGGPLTASPVASPDTICSGVLVQLDALVYGGSESYTYTWVSSPVGFSANTATPTTSPNTTTMYYVTIDDGYNSIIDSVEVYVHTQITPSFTGLAASYCIDAPSATLAGIPLGGTFTGLGISGSTFNPAIAGSGAHQIIYTYTDAYSCISDDTISTVVNSLPVVSFTGLAADYCIDATVATLVGTPTGGTFSGTGINGNDFSPATAGAGTHQIIYTYADGNGCISSDTSSTMVNTLPVVSFSGLMTDYCVDGMQDTLLGSPAGSAGVYCTTNCAIPTSYCTSANSASVDEYINNVSINSASNPSSGTLYSDYTSTLLTTLSTGQSYSMGVTVNAAGYTEYVSVFVDWNRNGTFEVGEETSFGSNYVIGNVVFTQNIVVPSTAVLGKTLMRVVNRYNAAAISCGTYSYGETEDYMIEIMQSSAGGSGVYTGMGITGNIFNPAVAGVGTHNIVYTFTDGNTCVNSDTNTTNVHTLPTPTFTGLASSYCTNSSLVSLTGTPSGGTFSGTGINGNSFNPSTAGVGTHQIVYTYTDANLCTAYDTQSVVVNSVPVVSITGLPAIMCSNESPVTLTLAPTGGLLVGQGVSGNIFNPTLAGAGIHSLTYLYTDNNGCSNTAQVTSLVNASYFIQQSQTICDNDSLLFNGNYVNTAGVYYDSSMTTNNCDSIVKLTLIVNPTYNTQLTSSICDNDSLLFGSIYYKAAGIYYDTLQSNNGCDSVIAMTISLKPTYLIQQSVDICDNDSLMFAGNYIKTTGVYYDNYTSAIGCDSIIELTLNVRPDYFTQYSATLCQGESLTYNGTVYNTAGVYYDTTITTFGCDSIIEVTLVFNPLPTVSLSPFVKDSVCSTYGLINLPAGIPTGGVYSGNGVVGGFFNTALVTYGKYWVYYTITDTNNCSNTDSTSIVVLNCTGLDEITVGMSVKLYPNPTKGQFQIDISGLNSSTLDMCIVNMSGQIILCEKLNNVNSADFTKALDFSNYPKGVYFIRLTTKDIVLTEKIIIQ